MSLLREIAEEFKKEIEKATAEFNTQPAQGSPGSGGNIARMNSGVTPHSKSAATGTKKRSSEQSQAKKQKKRAPQQPAAVTPTKVQTGTPVRTHPIIKNLSPATARNAIIMAEIIGPPLSKRGRKRTY